MLKRLISLIMIISLAAVFASCKEEEAVTEEEKECWAGQYVMVNEETEEFKILTVAAETETENDVVLTFKSVRSDDEFKGVLKTQSKKYAVCNAGDRCLKFNLKSTATVITVDDIWTSPETTRNENWTGKYVLIDDYTRPADFGDSSWNGEYTCAESGLDMSVYAIKEGVVLLTYTVPGLEPAEKINLKCHIDSENKREAVYTDESRNVLIKLVRSNKTIEITDTQPDGAVAVISGRYTR